MFQALYCLIFFIRLCIIIYIVLILFLTLEISSDVYVI